MQRGAGHGPGGRWLAVILALLVAGCGSSFWILPSADGPQRVTSFAEGAADLAPRETYADVTNVDIRGRALAADCVRGSSLGARNQRLPTGRFERSCHPQFFSEG